MTLDMMQDFEQSPRFVALDSHRALADEPDEPSIRSRAPGRRGPRKHRDRSGPGETTETK